MYTTGMNMYHNTVQNCTCTLILITNNINYVISTRSTFALNYFRPSCQREIIFCWDSHKIDWHFSTCKTTCAPVCNMISSIATKVQLRSKFGPASLEVCPNLLENFATASLEVHEVRTSHGNIFPMPTIYARCEINVRMTTAYEIWQCCLSRWSLLSRRWHGLLYLSTQMPPKCSGASCSPRSMVEGKRPWGRPFMCGLTLWSGSWLLPSCLIVVNG